MSDSLGKPVYLRIAINVPLRKSFDYSLPQDWTSSLPQPGVRIRVPFGRQSVIGILLKTHHDAPAFELKDIQEVLDPAPLFGTHLQNLLQWAAQYYCHAIGEVYAAALPLRLKQGKPATRPARYRWVSTTEKQETIKLLTRAPKQRALFEYIDINLKGRLETEISAQFIQWRQPLKALQEKQLIIKHEEPPENDPVTYQQPDFELNSAQQEALGTLIKHDHGFNTFLLHGVTGSGKTEIYLQASWHMLQQGKQVLVLVPEIGLTPQLVESFASRFSARIAVLHSGLNDHERMDTWLSARDGTARIIIGTRSAVFVPLQSPGLIIIDEEHDSSFKQMEGFRYSARDVGIKRASILKIPILLGSATPSLESLANTESGRSTLLALPERTGISGHPDIFRLDLRDKRLIAGLLPHTLNVMAEELDNGGQVLIFLNRRGYAPTLTCDSCGWVAECHHCDVRMTVHQRDARLRCHVCSYETSLPDTCPSCGSSRLIKLGYGTEKLENALQQQFPSAGVIRIDRDTTRRKHSFSEILKAVRSGQKRILIGTQMLAKGHHFPQVGVVIIVDADNGLYGLDFRAQEHMAQLITQVAGRAGRGHRQGRVFIQTRHPDHPFFEALQNLPYSELAAQLLNARRQTGMPPSGHLALLRAESGKMEQTDSFMQEASEASQDLLSDRITLLGPAIAPLERKAGHYRMQLLLRSSDRASLHRMLNTWLARLEQLGSAKRTRWSIDVDPYSLY